MKFLSPIYFCNMGRKRGVYTTYKCNGKSFCSYIVCNTLEEAEMRAAVRGLGETIDSSVCEVELIPDFKELNNLQFMSRIGEVLHACSFLSFLALKASFTGPEFILGDEGVLHDLIHLMNEEIPLTDENIMSVRGKLESLQRIAPGAY